MDRSAARRKRASSRTWEASRRYRLRAASSSRLISPIRTISSVPFPFLARVRALGSRSSFRKLGCFSRRPVRVSSIRPLAAASGFLPMRTVAQMIPASSGAPMVAPLRRRSIYCFQVSPSRTSAAPGFFRASAACSFGKTLHLSSCGKESLASTSLQHPRAVCPALQTRNGQINVRRPANPVTSKTSMTILLTFFSIRLPFLRRMAI